jgi:hypothetical protein
LLACCWTVEQIECFIMAHQVTLWSEVSIINLMWCPKIHKTQCV